MRGPEKTPRSYRHLVSVATDIGRSHHVNQDASGAWTWIRPDGVPASLVVVADGVSAGRHSEDASRLTVDTLYSALRPLMQDPALDVNALADALLASAKVANHAIAQRPHDAPSTADATTLVTALCVGDRGAGAWCGDSRVYHVRQHDVLPLTVDHSWAEGMVRHGLMTAEQAAQDPRAHMITRWLGPPDQEDPGLETFEFHLAPGESVLCCSDGLYAYFSPPAHDLSEIARIVREPSLSLQQATERLVALALERGGHDNISAAALHLDMPL